MPACWSGVLHHDTFDDIGHILAGVEDIFHVVVNIFPHGCGLFQDRTHGNSLLPVAKYWMMLSNQMQLRSSRKRLHFSIDPLAMAEQIRDFA